MASRAEGLGTKPVFTPNLQLRRFRQIFFAGLGVLAILVGLGTLLLLIVDVIRNGAPWLSWRFLTNPDSRFAEEAGMRAALYGTVLVMLVTIAFALPVGVMTAIYLEEYAEDNPFTRFVRVNISNLAGVPSIVYGLLGLQIFVQILGPLTGGPTILSGGLTMALLILPIIIVASQEAIRAVPQSVRDASLALGATKWQTTWHHVLPYAFGGILTGNILAASRAIGETAPLLVVGAASFINFTPNGLRDRFTALPIQIFYWTAKAQKEFQEGLSPAGIIVLLALLLLMNSVAIVLRQRLQRRY